MSQLVKIAGEIARQAAAHYAATAGNARVWDRRDLMIEQIGQSVEADIASIEGDSDASIAVRGEWLALANRRRNRRADDATGEDR